jgi:hypothetical protein
MAHPGSELVLICGWICSNSQYHSLRSTSRTFWFLCQQVTPSTSEGVDAAYFRSTPNSIGSVFRSPFHRYLRLSIDI